MRHSIFNTHVSLPDDQVFLMNTFNDAQIVVSSHVVALLDRLGYTEDRETHGHAADHAHVSSEEFTDAELDVLDELRGTALSSTPARVNALLWTSSSWNIATTATNSM